MPDDALMLELDGWEGPLDVLLSLARVQKVDLRDISILHLTEQYLDFIDEARVLRLELAADYLVMAAWLAFLKSALLLPHEPEAEPDPRDLALRLQHRLARLAAMREAGARLMARDQIGREVFLRGAPHGLRVTRRAVWSADIYELIAAYGRVSARTRPVLHVVADREVMTLDDAIARVAAMVGEAIDWQRLERFLPESPSPPLRRSALASSFLATLELARQGRIELRQASAFAPLYVRPIR